MPITILDYDFKYRELWAAHSALMRLGFLSQDMFVAVGNVVGFGEDTLHLRLETQGKQFVMSIARLAGVSQDLALETWRGFITTLQEASDEQINQCWRASILGRDHNQFLLLITTLKDRGFAVPAVDGLDFILQKQRGSA